MQDEEAGKGMIYLENFRFATEDEEDDFFIGELKRTCYDTIYPFRLFSRMGWTRVDFEPITIFYGGNGSGKSTALNVIADKIGSERATVYNKSALFERYVKFCQAGFASREYENNCIITSDGVFDSMLDIRNLNQGIDNRREDLFEEYSALKLQNQSDRTRFQLQSLDDIDELRKINMVRSKTQSKFVRKNLVNNVREYSNGESAFQYFVNKIDREGIYILDEPENSLSPKKQLELVKFIEDSARFYQCQFVIATHSPFLLSLKGAKIYDLDEEPVDVKRWTELENVQTYFQFFKEHWDKF